MFYQVLVGRSLLLSSLVITKVTKINENQRFPRILMKSMDFKILDVAILTRSRLQPTEQLIPPRKWTFPKRLRKFETNVHVLSGFGRSFLTREAESIILCVPNLAFRYFFSWWDKFPNLLKFPKLLPEKNRIFTKKINSDRKLQKSMLSEQHWQQLRKKCLATTQEIFFWPADIIFPNWYAQNYGFGLPILEKLKDEVHAQHQSAGFETCN